MTMKIQNAMPSGRVIIVSSGECDAKNVHRQLTEEKNQVYHRQRQYQFCRHEQSSFARRFRSRDPARARPST